MRGGELADAVGAVEMPLLAGAQGQERAVEGAVDAAKHLTEAGGSARLGGGHERV